MFQCQIFVDDDTDGICATKNNQFGQLDICYHKKLICHGIKYPSEPTTR